MSAGTAATASVSTHILDTSVGRPAADVAVSLAARTGPDAAWQALGDSRTDADGRCKDLPALPEGTAQVRLEFATEEYFAGGIISGADGNQAEEQGRETSRRSGSGAFFPAVTVTFTVTAGEHYHVPLLLNPFGYSVYRGS
ncbi:hydroxyisourate hydrolase [Streptomyces sp. GMY02]|uniref:hydroxyisourate hydrolase n=1 Tax=Streptomyces sp. GMY02 TaxID=1333528 RepID=UPI001C2C1A7B|nr:hydroxyisourate hydrolase [Streptomyces sp. GMY02]QXE34065.1 hydroxyisourate hydrolase [Streptomyces sp. GMY02]